MRLHIRNMVCHNCVNALKRELTQSGYHVDAIGLGFAEISAPDNAEVDIDAIKRILEPLGFELIEDSSTRLVEQVKLEVIRHINSEEPCNKNLSQCISDATGHDYKSVSRIFSVMEGRTIEKFHVAAKIEKAKELLSYGDIPLTEIAYRLGYSSVAFLSRQFKQETGMTPTQFQKSRHERRSLSDI